MIKLKNAFIKYALEDGRRVLIETLWPLELDIYYYKIDAWLRDLAPSYRIFNWLRGHPKDWGQFKQYYLEELQDIRKKELLVQLSRSSQTETVTLLYAGKNIDETPAKVVFDLISGFES
jgi:uncharacterized protein YeaO (DUF488 family)